MAQALRPPVKRLERLLAQADRLASWTRAQGYLSGSSKPATKRAPRSRPARKP